MEKQLVIATSLGAGGVRLTIKNVPKDLHDKIINKFSSYSDLFELMQWECHKDPSHEEAVKLYNEFLCCEDVKPFEVFCEENE